MICINIDVLIRLHINCHICIRIFQICSSTEVRNRKSRNSKLEIVFLKFSLILYKQAFVARMKTRYCKIPCLVLLNNYCPCYSHSFHVVQSFFDDCELLQVHRYCVYCCCRCSSIISSMSRSLRSFHAFGKQQMIYLNKFGTILMLPLII